MRADELDDLFVHQFTLSMEPESLSGEVVVVMPDDGARYAVSGAKFNEKGELEILIS